MFCISACNTGYLNKNPSQIIQLIWKSTRLFKAQIGSSMRPVETLSSHRCHRGDLSVIELKRCSIFFLNDCTRNQFKDRHYGSEGVFQSLELQGKEFKMIIIHYIHKKNPHPLWEWGSVNYELHYYSAKERGGVI